ncbi:hypothetical protein ABBQ38_008121 [Trebouxia sp. C0009 RCD-2024]
MEAEGTSHHPLLHIKHRQLADISGIAVKPEFTNVKAAGCTQVWQADLHLLFMQQFRRIKLKLGRRQDIAPKRPPTRQSSMQRCNFQAKDVYDKGRGQMAFTAATKAWAGALKQLPYIEFGIEGSFP